MTRAGACDRLWRLHPRRTLLSARSSHVQAGQGACMRGSQRGLLTPAKHPGLLLAALRRPALCPVHVPGRSMVSRVPEPTGTFWADTAGRTRHGGTQQTQQGTAGTAHTSGTWPVRKRHWWTCSGGLRKLAQQTLLPVMSLPRSKGAVSTLGQTSPPAGSSTPLMPPARAQLTSLLRGGMEGGASGSPWQEAGAMLGWQQGCTHWNSCVRELALLARRDCLSHPAGAWRSTQLQPTSSVYAACRWSQPAGRPTGHSVRGIALGALGGGLSRLWPKPMQQDGAEQRASCGTGALAVCAGASTPRAGPGPGAHVQIWMQLMYQIAHTQPATDAHQRQAAGGRTHGGSVQVLALGAVSACLGDLVGVRRQGGGRRACRPGPGAGCCACAPPLSAPPPAPPAAAGAS